MGKSNATSRRPILETTDQFVAVVPLGEHRAVVMHRRSHGGRTYVRFRTWNRHRRTGDWYPTARQFVIPIGRAQTLAEAILSAVHGDTAPEPDWLTKAREAEEAARASEAAAPVCDDAADDSPRARVAKQWWAARERLIAAGEW